MSAGGGSQGAEIHPDHCGTPRAFLSCAIRAQRQETSQFLLGSAVARLGRGCSIAWWLWRSLPSQLLSPGHLVRRWWRALRLERNGCDVSRCPVSRETSAPSLRAFGQNRLLSGCPLGPHLGLWTLIPERRVRSQLRANTDTLTSCCLPPWLACTGWIS